MLPVPIPEQLRRFALANSTGPSARQPKPYILFFSLTDTVTPPPLHSGATELWKPIGVFLH